MLKTILEFFRGLRQYDYVPPKSAPAIRFPPTPAQPPGPLIIPAETAHWAGVVLHHSSTCDTDSDDWEGIRRYHTSYRIDHRTVSKDEFDRRKAARDGIKFEEPWKYVGYHFCLERINGVLTWQMGRPWTMAGAHAGTHISNEFNKTHLGCCIIGDFDKKIPDRETWDACLAACRQLMSVYGFSKDNVIGHKEVFDALKMPRQKTCPGDMWMMGSLRGEL